MLKMMIGAERRRLGTALLLVFLFCSVVALLLLPIFSPPSEALLTVAFLNVGQGDAIFIESPVGTQMLIDGGPDASILRELGNVMGFSDRSIDVVLGTHSDTDHIGGLSYVLKRYDVAHIFHSGVSSDTPAYEAFKDAFRTSGGLVYVTMRDTIVDLGSGAYVRVIFPDRRLSENTEANLSSAVVEVVYGDMKFLLTGDAPKSIEAYIVHLEGSALASEVFKVGHHGSNTSSADAFVAAVHPVYAVISAGKDNRYGHPHKEVLDRLGEEHVTVVGTYDRGTIIFETDGKELWLKK